MQPLVRGLSVLEAFISADRWLGNKDIGRRTGLPAATVSRLTRTLTDLGYLAVTPRQRRYRLAAPVLGLGYAVAANKRAREHIVPRLQRIADRFNVTVALGERDRLDIQLLEVCHSSHADAPLGVEQGSRFPIAGTVLGSALIYALPEDERRYLLSHLKELHSEQWPSIKRRIATDIEVIRSQGFCVSHGSRRNHVSMIVAPLILPDRSSVWVVGCFNPAGLFPGGRVEDEMGEALRGLAGYPGDIPGI